MKVIVLCSGGMDSVAALHWARRHHDVVAVASFDYGAKHNHRELPFAAEHAAALGVRHEVIAMEFVNRLFTSDLLKSGGDIPEGHYEAENMKQTVVPFRNAIMLSIACGFAESVGAGGLVIAAHGGDHAIYPDCREDFMRAMGDAMRLGTYAGVQLLRPFIRMTKGDIAAEGARLGVDFARTWSCYKGGAIHCGRCGTCVERREAFARRDCRIRRCMRRRSRCRRSRETPPRGDANEHERRRLRVGWSVAMRVWRRRFSRRRRNPRRRSDAK